MHEKCITKQTDNAQTQLIIRCYLSERILDSQLTREGILYHLGTASRFSAPLGSKGKKAYPPVFTVFCRPLLEQVLFCRVSAVIYLPAISVLTIPLPHQWLLILTLPRWVANKIC